MSCRTNGYNQALTHMYFQTNHGMTFTHVSFPALSYPTLTKRGAASFAESDPCGEDRSLFL